MPGLAQRSAEGRIAGHAVTMKVGRATPPPGLPVHLGCTAIEAGCPGVTPAAEVIAESRRQEADGADEADEASILGRLRDGAPALDSDGRR